MELEKKKLELYIHIPFCVKKCNYCDFLSSPADRGTQESYMVALFSEIAGRAGDYRAYQWGHAICGGSKVDRAVDGTDQRKL